VEVVMTYFKVLFQHLPEGNKKNHKKEFQSAIAISKPEFEPVVF
jgi:hypothetical protein